MRELIFGQCLCEDIGHLTLGRHIFKPNMLFRHMVPDEMVADIDMLGSRVQHWVVCDRDRACVVTEYGRLSGFLSIVP